MRLKACLEEHIHVTMVGLIISVVDADDRQSESLDAGPRKLVRPKYIIEWPFPRSTSKGLT